METLVCRSTLRPIFAILSCSSAAEWESPPLPPLLGSPSSFGGGAAATACAVAVPVPLLHAAEATASKLLKTMSDAHRPPGKGPARRATGESARNMGVRRIMPCKSERAFAGPLIPSHRPARPRPGQGGQPPRWRYTCPMEGLTRTEAHAALARMHTPNDRDPTSPTISTANPSPATPTSRSGSRRWRSSRSPTASSGATAPRRRRSASPSVALTRGDPPPAEPGEAPRLLPPPLEPERRRARRAAHVHLHADEGRGGPDQQLDGARARRTRSSASSSTAR